MEPIEIYGKMLNILNRKQSWSLDDINILKDVLLIGINQGIDESKEIAVNFIATIDCVSGDESELLGMMANLKSKYTIDNNNG